MKRGGGVHTVPEEGAQKGWWNEKDGRVLSRHRTKEIAVAGGE